MNILLSCFHVFSSTTDNVNTNFAAVKLLGIEHPIGCVCHFLDLSLAEVYKSSSFKSINYLI